MFLGALEGVRIICELGTFEVNEPSGKVSSLVEGFLQTGVLRTFTKELDFSDPFILPLLVDTLLGSFWQVDRGVRLTEDSNRSSSVFSWRWKTFSSLALSLTEGLLSEWSKIVSVVTILSSLFRVAASATLVTNFCSAFSIKVSLRYLIALFEKFPVAFGLSGLCSTAETVFWIHFVCSGVPFPVGFTFSSRAFLSALVPCSEFSALDPSCLFLCCSMEFGESLLTFKLLDITSEDASLLVAWLTSLHLISRTPNSFCKYGKKKKV